MSRHLLIRCDRAGCPEQVITGASDTTPTGITVPNGWLTLREEGLADKHYCSTDCLLKSLEEHLWSVAATPSQQPSVVPSPYAAPASVVPEPLTTPTRSRKKAH